MKLTYTNVNGYLIPNLTYKSGEQMEQLDKYGYIWVIRILANVAVLFIVEILMVITMETIKQYKKMWNKISQMFLIGSLSGIEVLGDVIGGYLPVNLILLFVFVNMEIVLLDFRCNGYM